MNENRNSFKGSIGFVLAAAGSAVGLVTYGDFLIWQLKMEADYSSLFTLF